MPTLAPASPDSIANLLHMLLVMVLSHRRRSGGREAINPQQFYWGALPPKCFDFVVIEVYMYWHMSHFYICKSAQNVKFKFYMQSYSERVITSKALIVADSMHLHVHVLEKVFT